MRLPQCALFNRSTVRVPAIPSIICHAGHRAVIYHASWHHFGPTAEDSRQPWDGPPPVPFDNHRLLPYFQKMSDVRVMFAVRGGGFATARANALWRVKSKFFYPRPATRVDRNIISAGQGPACLTSS